MYLNPVQDNEIKTRILNFLPSDGEIRYLSNRNKECGKFMSEIDQCRVRMSEVAAKKNSNEFQQLGFLPCKRFVDAHYRCMTSDKFGSTIDDLPELAFDSADKFFNCTFSKFSPISECKEQFDQIVRTVFRTSSKSFLLR